MTGLRKVADERDARACLSALAKSGETLRGWARRNRVDGRSLRAWQINLSRAATTALARRVPAQLIELVPATRPTMAGRYVVRVGACSVDVGDDFDAGTLGRIVEVLRSC